MASDINCSEEKVVGTPMAAREFENYALAQATYGRRLLLLHRRDATDCCRQCGRPHPCEQRRFGGQLVVHFDQWNPAQNITLTVSHMMLPAGS